MTTVGIFTTFVLAATAVAILVGLGVPPGHSADFNFSWSVNYTGALSWSDPLPRYLPDLWAGFGGHDFFFYGPLPFWFTGAVVAPLCPGCSPATEYVLGSAVFLGFAGLAGFAFLRLFFPVRSAAFGAICYVILPYHLLLDWFERQAVGEFAAYAFLPLIALGMEKLRRNEGGGWLLSLGVAGTSFCHLPTALLAGHVFGVLSLAFALGAPGAARDKLALFGRLALYAVLGLMLSALYWLPALALFGTVSTDSMFSPYFEAWRWLFGQEQAVPGEYFFRLVLLSFFTALPIVLGSLVHARGALLLWILLPVAVTVILNHAIAEPIWKNWIIAKVQFPWRMMSLVDFAAAIAAATLAANVHRPGGKAVLGLGFVAAAIPYVILTVAVEFSQPTQPVAEGGAARAGAIEYLSPEATDAVRRQLGNGDLRVFTRQEIATGYGVLAGMYRTAYPDQVILDRRARSLAVRPKPGDPEVSLPIQYWFLWQARTGDGDPLRTRANARFGTLEVIAPAGGFDDSPIMIALPFHWSEKLGFALSALALVLLAGNGLRVRRAPD